MALDHSRLGVENKSGPIFAFDKFNLQNLANKSGCMQTNLLKTKMWFLGADTYEI